MEIYSKKGQKYYEPESLSPLANLVSKRMREKNLSGVELSERSGVPTSILSYYLRGKRRFSVSHIVRIALALGLDAFEMARIQSDDIISEYIKSTFNKEDNDEVSVNRKT